MAPIGNNGIRLQKFLSGAGLTSRRKGEEMIAAGRVTVNGQVVTELGTRVNPLKDNVAVDGARVRMGAPVYVLMHKPKGTVCSERDPEGRARVHDLLPKGLPRVFTVGRLDWDTEGLLLFTNDGDLAKALMDPVQHVPRVYRVKIQGQPDPHLVRRFNEGVRLPSGYRTRSAPIELVQRTDTNAWYEVVLSEGKNRQIHRMVEACGRRVLKLVRVAYGTVRIGTLPPGKCRMLTPEEVAGLEEAVGLQRGRFAGAPEAPRVGAPRPGARAAYTRSHFKTDEVPKESRGAGRPRAPAKPAESRPSPRAPAKPAGSRPSPRAPAKPAGSRPSPRAPAKPAGSRPSPRAPAKPPGSRPPRKG